VSHSRRPAKKPSCLSLPLTHRLNTYALGACAAGVSLLALKLPSEAEVIYTPANVVIGRDGSYGIDLNNDGIVDYRIVEFGGMIGNPQSLEVDPLNGNEVACMSSPGCLDFNSAAALPAGVQIGYNPFWERGFLFGLAVAGSFDGEIYYRGFWPKTKDHYLPLRFQINGETHYGWARLTVKFVGVPPKDGTWQATLSGYAYETIPNKSIISGQTSGTDDDRQSSGASVGAKANEKKQPVSLGTLALGKE